MTDVFFAPRRASALLLLGLLCAGLCPLHSQGVPIAYTSPHIGSVRLHPEGAPLGGPFLELGGEARLVLRYDDLSGDWPDHEWTLVHCTADWSALTDLGDWEYLEGWNPAEVDNVENSFGGAVSFAHAATPIPSRDLAPNRSGNYLLIVHESGDPDAIVLMRRLVVYERLCAVEMAFRRPLDAGKVPTHQRLEVDVELPPGHRWTNPMRDVRLSVIQNVAWPWATHEVPAARVLGNTVTFAQHEGLTFAGGDRWRSADLKSLAYLAPGIDRISESKTGDGPLWQIRMSRDESRRFRMQSSRPDLKGAFTTHNDRFDDVDLTSDYLDVQFRLEHNNFGDVPDVYLFGAVSGWSLEPAFRMEYVSEDNEYRLDLLLKQGWYDYQYVTPSGGDVSFEGSHAGTANRYHVLVHVPAPDGTDRIIGFEALDSN